MIKLRKASINDLDIFEDIREEKLPELHKGRIKNQDEGKAEYLIAFEDDTPVGHVFILLKSDDSHHECPNLQDLFVKKSHRKKGIASQIINLAEARVKELDHTKIGIDIEEHETWVKEFYEKLGYTVASGPHKSSFVWKDTGETKTEKYYCMKKNI
jgi:GNAT superfamily N-acetyltransferase